MLPSFRPFSNLLDQRGAASIEFGIVGAMYVLVLLAAFECGYMVFLQASLDNAARDAARLIRTGQAQASSNPQAAFQTLLCGEIGTLIPCRSVLYQSQAYANWSQAQAGANASPTRDASGNLVSRGFSIGTAGEIIVMQVTYNYPFFTPLLGNLLGNGTNSTLLMSSVVFRNEQF
jgi:Flp pilus assembly protein TadG